MLGTARDEMPAAILPAPCQSDHREIIRLGAASCKHDLMRFGAEQSGDPVPCIIHHRPGLASGLMNA